MRAYAMIQACSVVPGTIVPVAIVNHNSKVYRLCLAESQGIEERAQALNEGRVEMLQQVGAESRYSPSPKK